MTPIPAWLPPLLTMEACDGNWDTFLELLYVCFRRDFIETQPHFRGRRLGLKRYPLSQGKEATFWHFITEGAVEAERTIGIRRCERIGWPRPTIEHEAGEDVRVWQEGKLGDIRIHIWVLPADYVVVLADRGHYILPWTAFPIEREHTRRKFERRYLAHRNAENREP